MKPKMFMFRLQKIMDEYAAGVTAGFKTNKPKLERALELLDWLKEDSEKLAAQDLHELMRCHENIQRMWQAESPREDHSVPRRDPMAGLLLPE